jgi:FixJ family two-component response regulator
MPGVDGIYLTKEISEHYQGLPVMIITGHTEEYPTETAMTSGAREFISKPFSTTEFMIRFDKMMYDLRAEKALLVLSLTDELTGLYNRRRNIIFDSMHL